MKTPYIKGRLLDINTKEDREMILEEVQWCRDNLDRKLVDFYVPGNIKLHPKYGALIIDFDQYVTINYNSQTSHASDVVYRSYGQNYIDSDAQGSWSMIQKFPGAFGLQCKNF